jgi:cytoskeletal protein CcmA (bactofilin family)
MKRILAVLLLFTSALIVAPVALAQRNMRSEEVSTLGESETIDEDYFATGEKVVLSGTVNGDAYLAGGNIIVDGVVNGDLLVAGGNLNIQGEVTGDIRAVGGDVQIDGVVGGNVTTVGGSIRVDDDSQIAGSMVAGGGNVEVFGPIGKGLTAGAGTLLIANSVGGNVVTGVGELDLSSNAVVNGELNYMSEEKARISRGATVSAGINHRVPPRHIDENKKEAIFQGAATGWTIFKYLSSFVIGAILLWGLPNFMQKTRDTLVKKPVQSLGLGFLVLVVTPVAAVILMITVIGLPLGLVLLLGYLFLIYVSKVFVAYAIGVRILNPKSNRYAALALGLLILAVVWFIPIIGGLVEFVAILLGLGTYAMTKRAMLQNFRSKKLL